MADTSAPHVTRVRLYRNGDPNFIGKLIVVNPRYYRNFETFLDTATWTTQSTSAVTRICTPQGRHNIDSVDKLANGGNYVAVGRERFKKLKYGDTKLKNVTTRLPPVWRSHLPSSGRFRKVYEGEKQALKRIYVYRNGDNKTPARMILLKKRTLTDMELVLAALQESNINFDFAISKLFTLNGKQIYTCDEIVHDGKYVALERGSRFKPINYGGAGYVSPRNPVTNYTRLPPIPTARSNQSKVSYSPRKIPQPPITQKPALAKPKKAKQTQIIKREEKIVVNHSLPQQESILSSFDDDKRESFSQVSLSVTPPTLDESPDFTLSEKIGRGKETSKESDEKDAFPKVAIPNDLDELPEQQKESIGLKLYNASGMQREWGDMVVENKDTVTEKLLDDVPAEEIVDEAITDSVEDKEENETITERIIDIVKDKLVDEKETVNEAVVESIEDVTESTEDVTESTEDGGERIKTSESKSSKNNDGTKGQEENETKGRESVEEVIEIDDNKNYDEKHNESNEKEKSDEDEEEEQRNTSPEVLVEKAALQSDDQRSKSEEPEQESQDEESENEDDKDKEARQEEGAEGSQHSGRSSQDMNSEDEVRSEDEQEENDDDDKDDTDDKDDEKSDEENDQSANDETDEATDDKNDESHDDNPSNTDPSSEKDSEEADEPATKENKTNKKVEEQRADPDVAKKKEIKQNNEKIKRKQKRVDTKA